MVLLACSAIFTLASGYKPVRRECLIMAAALLSTWAVANTLSADGDARYWIRAAIATLSAVALCGCRSLFGFYQAAIYAMVVSVYGLLAYDVAIYNEWVELGSVGAEPAAIVWGERYKGLIHGLVLCQLAGFLPVLWSAIRASISATDNSSSNLFWGKGGIKK